MNCSIAGSCGILYNIDMKYELTDILPPDVISFYKEFNGYQFRHFGVVASAGLAWGEWIDVHHTVLTAAGAKSEITASITPIDIGENISYRIRQLVML